MRYLNPVLLNYDLKNKCQVVRIGNEACRVI